MKYLIEKQSQLMELEHRFEALSEKGGVVAVDTEFLREKTYSARLCLVQLGIGEDQYCIDVLAISDLQILIDLFQDHAVLKLFHAARQDMEVIYQTFEVLPEPIFDTQLGAAFLGEDMQIGHTALVKERLDIDLPKSQARTDWTRRPLSEKQIEYAADDVAYLQQIYQQIYSELEDADKLDWYQEELREYYDPALYVFNPEDAYQRLSGGALDLKSQYTLRALAQWREAQAQKRDIPRAWIIRDEGMFDLAIKRPRDAEQVKSMQVFGRKSVTYLAPQVLDVIAHVEVEDEPLWRRAEPLDKHAKSVCSAMMKKLSKFAQEYQIAQGLLGTRRDIEFLFRYRESNRLLTGWRKKLVGEKLLEFLQSQDQQ
jgi:ribonuclease D